MNPSVAVLAGGVGAARFLVGLVEVTDPRQVVAVVNVGDDMVLHGLHISPDLDTVTFTLAGEINPETGWGLRGETWQAMDTLGRYGGQIWFNLGDRDLGTHLYRTQRRNEGAPLSQITAEIAAAWGLDLTLVPVTDDRVQTRVTLAADGREVDFQEYFVARRHDVEVSAVRFDGIDAAHPAPGVLDALGRCDAIVVAPSNPIVSIGPVLAVRGVRAALADRRDSVAAVSPIVAGAALKGPADRMLTELGHEASVVGVARLYRDIAGVLVIDEADRALAPAVEDEGVRCVVADTIMSDPGTAATLATAVLHAIERG